MKAPFRFSASAKDFQLFKSLTSLTSLGSLFKPAEKNMFSLTKVTLTLTKTQNLRQSYQGFYIRSWLIDDEVPCNVMLHINYIRLRRKTINKK